MDANSREKKRKNSYTTNLVVNQEKGIKKQVADSMEKEMSKLQKKKKAKDIFAQHFINAILMITKHQEKIEAEIEKEKEKREDIEDIKIKESMNKKASRNKKIGESKINRLEGNMCGPSVYLYFVYALSLMEPFWFWYGGVVFGVVAGWCRVVGCLMGGADCGLLGVGDEGMRGKGGSCVVRFVGLWGYWWVLVGEVGGGVGGVV
ncbi:hypothetical protein Tco_0257785 [Tanacetum coccineum]